MRRLKHQSKSPPPPKKRREKGSVQTIDTEYVTETQLKPLHKLLRFWREGGENNSS